MLFGELPRITPIKFKFEEGKFFDWDTDKDIITKRLEYATALPIKHLSQVENSNGNMIIVGAGPTLYQHVEDLIKLSKNPENVICGLNRVHEFLISKGIIPKIHVIFENDIEDVEQALGGPPHEGVTYYICSHCHENVFRQLEGFDCVLWHAVINHIGFYETMKRLFPEEPLVGADAGYVTFFRSLAIGTMLGYKNYELYGVDSSFNEESDRIDGYVGSDFEPKIEVWARKKTTGEMRKFKTTGSLAWQAYRFIFLCDANRWLNIRVHGDSLMRFIHQGKYPERYLNGSGS